MSPRLTAEDASSNAIETRHFPITKTPTDGIYVQGRQVMFKNVPDATGKLQNYSFAADEVALIFHQASFTFMFLGIGVSTQQSNYVILCNAQGTMLAAVPPEHKSVREFLVHLLAVNPQIQLDTYISRYVNGDTGVLWRRMVGKIFIALAINVAVWGAIIVVAMLVA